MYTPEPSEKALSGFGLRPSDYETTKPIIVWPENAQTVRVFYAMRRQWHSDMGVYIGLRYEVLPEIWRRLKVPPADRDEVFAGLEVMQDAALEAMKPPAKEKR